MGKLRLIPAQVGGVASVLGGALGMARPNEINRICPVIAPALGGELFANGGFGADTNWTKDAGWTIAAGVATHAAGSGSNIYQSVVSIGNWYQLAWEISAYNAGSFVGLLGIVTSQVVRTAIGVYTGTGLVGGTAAGVRGGSTADGSIDNASVKQITFNSAIVFLGSRNQRPGTYVCHPTVVTDTQCGGLLGYADASNFVQWIVNRAANQAQLIKCIAGTYTSVIAAAIAYSAAAELKVIVASNGTDYSLYYAGAQVGATTAINDAGLGTAVYGFNTYAGNTVGLVTTSGATS